MQEKIAQSVARVIQIAMEPPDESPRCRRAVNAAAQELYFQGFFAIRSATVRGIEVDRQWGSRVRVSGRKQNPTCQPTVKSSKCATWLMPLEPFAPEPPADIPAIRQ